MPLPALLPDYLAPRALRNFVEGFVTPYPYNKALFDLLVTTIEWESVTQVVNQRLQSFGRFLQSRQIREPLNWEEIEAVVPTLEPSRTMKEILRTCLLTLGHLLAARGELESREAFLERRRSLAPIERAPEAFQPVLRRYINWLAERKATASNLHQHLVALVSFWTWCEGRGVRTPAEVQEAIINDYLLTLYWQWQCSVCQNAAAFDPQDRKAPRTCAHCGAIGSLDKARRFTQHTVRGYRSRLRVFFSWARSNRMIIANPVRRQTAAPAPTIRHYSPEVIRELCSYIPAPDADPLKALVLYLIIFHALSVWELQHAQLPNFYPLHKGIASPTLAEAYHIRVPGPPPSLGDHSPGRPDIQVKFPVEAASWLNPLLERYERHRGQVVKGPCNRYLLCSPVTAHHNIPVGKTYVRKLVRRTTLYVLGKVCMPNTLRKTVGVMFADRAGAGFLRFLGWEAQQAFAYTWAERLTVHPKQADSSTIIESLEPRNGKYPGAKLIETIDVIPTLLTNQIRSAGKPGLPVPSN